MQPTDAPDVRNDDAPDTSDVVTGEIGHAHLREPADAEPYEADLDALPEIDTDQEPKNSA